jgi:hypothetical protein
MVIECVTGLFQRSDGSYGHVSSTPNGALHVQTLNGKYAELARRGYLFNYTVKTGAAILLSATTGNCATVWNPAGSNKILYICTLNLNFLAGTTTVSSLQWMITRNAGASFGTSGPIVTFTDQTPEPAIAGSQFASSMRFAPAVCTFTTAPAFLMSTGINLGAASPSAGAGDLSRDYDGVLAIMPGMAISLCASVTSTTSTWFTSILGAEIPLVDGK